MRSRRGLVASIIFLSALPVTALHQILVGKGAGAVIHGALAAGSGLMSFAAFDFKTPKWVIWMGSASSGGLAAVFLLQGVSELTHNEVLTRFAYQLLGQRLEGWLLDVFMAWCVAVLLVDSRGGTRILGTLAMAVVACVKVYAYGLAYQGTSLDATAPMLKVLLLLPFVWLFFESRKGA